MQKNEAMQVLAILKAAYPNSYRNITPEDAKATATVWAMQFADISVDVVLLAVNKCISTSQFPPAISEVRDKLSAVSWEAAEMLAEEQREVAAGLPPSLTSAKRQMLERISAETRGYRYAKDTGPSLAQMLPGGPRADRLEGWGAV